MVRKPAVSGYFYPSERETLQTMVKTMLTEEMKEVVQKHLQGVNGIIGVVSPHAGYMYSGKIAAYSFYALSLSPPVETVVIIGPNHRGVGAKVALGGEDFWQTPLGSVALDREAIDFLVGHDPVFRVDSEAHRLEHSLEVQLPFLQCFLSYDFKVVPIVLIKQDPVTARIIAEALKKLGEHRKLCIVASSDFSHYEQAGVAAEKDSALIARILSLDVDGFYEEIYARGISVCGPGGIAVLMEYYQNISRNKRGSLLAYAHSGEVTGDIDRVVGYASIIFPKFSP
ncbi:MAG: AmmeMemoRadiSam system protein B [Candidatus Atribacteria bacterium]|nr:AmmeMemoRadiSam system protein B [Candidatus Atribacteria bacterium]